MEIHFSQIRAGMLVLTPAISYEDNSFPAEVLEILDIKIDPEYAVITGQVPKCLRKEGDPDGLREFSPDDHHLYGPIHFLGWTTAIFNRYQV